MSGWWNIASSNPPHRGGTTVGTQTNVEIPDGFYELCYRKSGVTLFKTLPVLKLKNDFEILCFHPVIQKAVIAYFLKTTGEYMHQITPDEFRVVQGNLTFWLPRLFPSGSKGNLILCNGKNPVVGDGDSVGITSQILDGIAKPMKGFLDIGAPVLFIKMVLPFLPVIRIPQLFTGRRKNKGAAFVKGREKGHIFTFELIPQDRHRDKKFTGGFPDFPIPCKASAGNNAVHMDMITKLLVPRMEDLDDSGRCPEPLVIRR